jgi:inner membrane protein
MTSNISNDSFTAKWKSIAQKRSFPQQWKDNAFTISPKNQSSANVVRNDITDNAFGADLYVPVNGYQKTTRSIKYSFLCILLTFAAFFLIDTTNKKAVHPFQYGLVGLALVLFYTLLLSVSEYIGFTYAYAVASIATIGLIAWFVKGILGSFRLTTVLSIVLLFVYTYMFTILQLQDYALILGSIGLFVALAIIMHFSKKIEW